MTEPNPGEEHLVKNAPITVNCPVSNLIQFRIKWSYRHELHSSCSIKKQIFCMVMKSTFFSSSARSQILKAYLHVKNKSVLQDECILHLCNYPQGACFRKMHEPRIFFFYTFGSNMRSNINYNTPGKLNFIY